MTLENSIETNGAANPALSKHEIMVAAGRKAVETRRKNAAAALASAVLSAVEKNMPQPEAIPSFDEEAVKALIDAKIDELKKSIVPLPTQITVFVPPIPAATIDRQHYMFEALLNLCVSRTHVYLCGPAGTFKTSTAESVAKALNLTFDSTSVCNQTTKSDLLGFIDATGTYRETAFRRLFENGGVFLLDEIDNGNANVLAVLNAALANGAMTFPDKRITRHSDFILIAAANTYGGATTEYVGRNQLDAATLDRFAYLSWPMDRGLIMTLGGVPTPSQSFDLAHGGIVSPAQWTEFADKAGRAISNLKLRMVVGTRSILIGSKLASLGTIGQSNLANWLVFKNCDDATHAKINAEIERL